MASPLTRVGLVVGFLLVACAPVYAAPTALLSAGLVTEATPSPLNPVPAQVSVDLRLYNDEPPPPPRPQQTIEFEFPPEIRFDRSGFSECSADTINYFGEGVCPPASRVGSGSADLELGPGRTPLALYVTVYNAGPGRLALAFHQSGGSVQVAMEGVIDDSPDSLFGKRITVIIPSNVQQPAPNLFSEFIRLSLTIVARTTAPASFVFSSGCPDTPYRGSFVVNDYDAAAPLRDLSAGTCAIGTLPEPVEPGPTATVTASPSPSPTPAPSASPSPAPSASPSPGPEPSASPSPSPAPSASPAPEPARCKPPKLKGKRLRAARRTIARTAGCQLGRVKRPKGVPAKRLIVKRARVREGRFVDLRLKARPKKKKT